MFGLGPATKIYLGVEAVDMRKGFDGLAALVQDHLRHDPFSGQAFVFRGRRGDLVKIVWWDGQGLCLFAKRLERGRFVWPSTEMLCSSTRNQSWCTKRRGSMPS